MLAPAFVPNGAGRAARRAPRATARKDGPRATDPPPRPGLCRDESRVRERPLAALALVLETPRAPRLAAQARRAARPRHDLRRRALSPRPHHLPRRALRGREFRREAPAA